MDIFSLQVAADTEVRRLQQRIADLELQLAESRRSEIEVREERDLERLRSALSPGRRHTTSYTFFNIERISEPVNSEI